MARDCADGLAARPRTQRTQGVRWLIDTLFSREQDRVQQAVLWARGRYQRS